MKRLFSYDDFVKYLSTENYRTIIMLTESLKLKFVKVYDRKRWIMGTSSTTIRPSEVFCDWTNVNPSNLFIGIEEKTFNTKDRFWIMDNGCFSSTNDTTVLKHSLIDAIYYQYENYNIDEGDIVPTFKNYLIEM